MSSKLNNNIGYTWLCQMTQKLFEQGKITKEQQRKINALNAEKLNAEIIINC